MGIINWSNVTLRYKVASDYAASSTDQAAYILYAENDINSRLASCFTVPFSSNNITAKDMVIDVAFANTQKFKDNDKFKAVIDHIDKITEALKVKQQGMMLDDGSVVYADVSIRGSGIYSNTQDFHSVFDMGDEESMCVSSQQLESESNIKF